MHHASSHVIPLGTFHTSCFSEFEYIFLLNLLDSLLSSLHFFYISKWRRCRHSSVCRENRLLFHWAIDSGNRDVARPFSLKEKRSGKDTKPSDFAWGLNRCRFPWPCWSCTRLCYKIWIVHTFREPFDIPKTSCHEFHSRDQEMECTDTFLPHVLTRTCTFPHKNQKSLKSFLRDTSMLFRTELLKLQAACGGPMVS